MRKEAEMHAQDDRKRRELIDVRNQADQLIHVVDKTLKDAGDPSTGSGQAKIEAGVKKSVEEKLAELRKVKDGSDAEVIKRAIETLSQEIQKVGSAMYAAQAEQAKQGEQKQAEKDGDGKNKAEDAQFEEKK